MNLDFAFLGEQAGVAGRLFPAQIEHHQLPVEADGGARDERPRVLDTGAIEQMPRGEVVRAVEHHVGARRQRFQLARTQAFSQRHDFDLGIDRQQRGASGFDLGVAERFGPVEDLSLQVGEIDLVGVGQGQAADACRGEVKRGRTAEAAGADDQRGGGTELLLTLDPDLGKEDVPAVPEELLVSQFA